MYDPNKKARPEISPSDVCHRAFELIGVKKFEDAEKLLLSNMSKSDDDTAIALYHSTLGVLYKVKEDYKTAWKHYQRAEKLLPNDPALKIISARLLIDQFAEYSQAIKKAKKVVKLVPHNPVFLHQAYITIGLAELKKGEKKKAIESLKKSIGDDFHGFITGKNIDLHLVEGILRRGWGKQACFEFLEKALVFVKKIEEEAYIRLFSGMVEAFHADEEDEREG